VFEVKATSGDTQLGGTDMNQRIFDHLVERFQMSTGVDVRSDRKAAARLIEAAETAKIELSNSVSTHLSLPYLAAVKGEPRHLELDLNRTELERLIRPVIERCRGPVDQALKDAGITPRDVNRVVFVGGPTRMPSVRSYFEDIFGHKAEMGIDPMECVAAGASIQAGVLSGEVGGIVLVDVTPLTLGVETLGGIATPLIARNTPIPVKRTESFTTAADMQTTVTVHVFQGERPMASDNTSLGQFNLDGLPPAPRGVPKIEVSFDIDSNGILNVSAKDTASGKSQSISITASTRLSESEKKRMVEDAERYADADKKRRDDAVKLNEADSNCYEAEKLLANYAEKMTDDLKRRIESVLRDTKEALLKKDVNLATERAENLKKVLREAGAVLYSQSGQADKGGPYAETRWAGTEPPPNVGAGTKGARTGEAGTHGKVVDAEYRENK
jgi:molecular chaperone DnaK